jgi:hypothetical protein
METGWLCDVSRDTHSIYGVGLLASQPVACLFCMPSTHEMDFELSTSPSSATNEHHPSVSEPAAPPADTGRAAWLFLASCVVIEVLVWGK